MKKLHAFFRSLPLYLLVIVTIGICFWQDTLPVAQFVHSLFLIIILLVSGLLINHWISNHIENFLVPQSFIYEQKRKEFESEKKTARMEK
jgi:hypothetical protein